jgi:hypothetical protein
MVKTHPTPKANMTIPPIITPSPPDDTAGLSKKIIHRKLIYIFFLSLLGKIFCCVCAVGG